MPDSLPSTRSAAAEPVLAIAPVRGFLAHQRLGLADFAAGARLWRLAWTLAWFDIRLRYRGSVLGPFWLTLSTGIMVAAMGGIYATLFHLNLHDYLPFLAVSQVLWAYLATLAQEGCTTFTAAETTIRGIRMPVTLHPARIVLRNLVVLAHNLVVIVVVFVVMQVWPGAGLLGVLPALALWLVDSMALALLLGAICARFRDVPPIVGSIMQMAFFVTPVIWKPELLGAKAWMLPFNPFYTLLEVLRAPMLGNPISSAVWVSALISSVVLWGSAWLLFARVRGRIPFWV